MNFLITGSNGFIGKTLCSSLSAHGHKVTKIEKNNTYSPEKYLNDNFDCLVHLAGLAHVKNRKVLQNYNLYRNANLIYSIKIANLAKNLKIRRFVFISSIGVNGSKTENTPFTEKDVSNPHSPYSTSKLEAEVALQKLFVGSSTELTIIRPPLVYGANAKANFKHLVYLCKLPLPLPFGSINNLRSFIGIDNLCDFIELCSEHPAAANQTFLISDNFDVSTTELILTIREACNKKPLLVPIPPLILSFIFKTLGKKNLSDQLLSNLQVDITKAITLLAWRPKLSFREGIKRAVTK